MMTAAGGSLFVHYSKNHSRGVLTSSFLQPIANANGFAKAEAIFAPLMPFPEQVKTKLARELFMDMQNPDPAPYDGQIKRDVGNPPLENFHWELTKRAGNLSGQFVAQYVSAEGAVGVFRGTRNVQRKISCGRTVSHA